MSKQRGRYYNFEINWQYSYLKAKKIVAPMLKEWGIDLKEKMIIDIGCNNGGTTCFFSELGAASIGIDTNEESMNAAQEIAEKKGYMVSFFVGDVCRDIPISNEYHLAFMLDLLEHVSDVKKALTNVSNILKTKGLIYVNFPPFRSALGGHQQLMRYSVVQYIPYVHLLPQKFFLKLVSKKDKNSPYLYDILSLGRLTIGHFENIIKELNLKILKKEYFLSSPSHNFRFPLIPVVKAPLLGKLPVIKEYLIQGVYYLLQKDT